MKQQRSERTKARILTAVLLALGTSSGAGCAGGGGGGGDEDAFIPSMLAFSLGTTGGGGAPLTVEYAGEDVVVDMMFAGMYDVDRDDWATDRATTFTLDTGVARFGVLEVSVLLELAGAAWDRPRRGSLEVRQASTGDVVTISVSSTVDGVDVHFDEDGDGVNVLGPFTHTWGELLELYSTSAQDDERIASLAWTVVELLRERFLIVFELFYTIFDLQEFLEGIGPEANVEIPNACATLPGSGTIGDGIFRWHDDNMDGLIDSGDSFSVILTDCWVDAPGDFDHVYDGTFELTGFVYVERPFETGATVDFAALNDEVVVDLGGVFTAIPELETETSGGVSVGFE